MSVARVKLWIDPTFNPETRADLGIGLPKDPLPSNWEFGYLFSVFGSCFVSYMDERRIKIKDFRITDWNESVLVGYVCEFSISEPIGHEYLTQIEHVFMGKALMFQVLEEENRSRADKGET